VRLNESIEGEKKRSPEECGLRKALHWHRGHSFEFVQRRRRYVSGFTTIFYRAMCRTVKDEKSGLTERFQFRDLRAKSASDDTVEAAAKSLGHADPKITERVYRRKAERAKPLC
jgi:integrase